MSLNEKLNEGGDSVEKREYNRPEYNRIYKCKVSMNMFYCHVIHQIYKKEVLHTLIIIDIIWNTTHKLQMTNGVISRG